MVTSLRGSNNSARRTTTRFAPDILEDRVLPTVSVADVAIPKQAYVAPANRVMVERINIRDTQSDLLTGITVKPHSGTSAFPGYLSRGYLSVWVNNRWSQMDTSPLNSDGTISFQIANWKLRANSIAELAVTADIAPTVPKSVVVDPDVKSVTLKDASGRPVALTTIAIANVSSETILVPEINTVGLYAALTPPERYADTQYANMGAFTVYTVNGALNVQNLSFAIQERTAAGAGIWTLDHVRLYNARTGAFIPLTQQASGTGYKVFGASNFAMNNGDRFEIFADISSTTPAGSRISVQINEDPTANHGSMARLVAKDASSGLRLQYAVTYGVITTPAVTVVH